MPRLWDAVIVVFHHNFRPIFGVETVRALFISLALTIRVLRMCMCRNCKLMSIYPTLRVHSIVVRLFFSRGLSDCTAHTQTHIYSSKSRTQGGVGTLQKNMMHAPNGNDNNTTTTNKQCKLNRFVYL